MSKIFRRNRNIKTKNLFFTGLNWRVFIVLEIFQNSEDS